MLPMLVIKEQGTLALACNLTVLAIKLNSFNFVVSGTKLAQRCQLMTSLTLSVETLIVLWISAMSSVLESNRNIVRHLIVV